MADEQPDYTNLDLDTAEQMLIDAGQPELAAAQRRYQHGIRNMMQAAIVPGFVRTLESVVAKQIGALATKMDDRDRVAFEWRVESRERTDRRFDNFGKELDAGFAEVRGLRGDFTALQAEFQHFRADLATLKQDMIRLDEGQAHLRKDHVDFRSNQETFRVAQDMLVGKVVDLGENFDTLQQIFDLLKDEGERRWAHATAALADQTREMTEQRRALADQTQEMSEQRVIIERKERQIKELIEQVQALRAELNQVRADTIADEIGADERRRLTETTRWMTEHRDLIVLKDAPGGSNDHR